MKLEKMKMLSFKQNLQPANKKKIDVPAKIKTKVPQQVTTQEVRLFEDKGVRGKRLKLAYNCLLAIALLYQARKTFPKLKKCV